MVKVKVKWLFIALLIGILAATASGLISADIFTGESVSIRCDRDDKANYSYYQYPFVYADSLYTPYAIVKVDIPNLDLATYRYRIYRAENILFWKFSDYISSATIIVDKSFSASGYLSDGKLSDWVMLGGLKEGYLYLFTIDIEIQGRHIGYLDDYENNLPCYYFICVNTAPLWRENPYAEDPNYVPENPQNWFQYLLLTRPFMFGLVVVGMLVLLAVGSALVLRILRKKSLKPKIKFNLFKKL